MKKEYTPKEIIENPILQKFLVGQSVEYLYATAEPRVLADKLYRAACCLVVDPETNLILAVSRKTNHEQFGFPGGTVEDNETFLEGAIRELKEETGYIINDDYKPQEVHEHLVKDRHVKLFSIPLNKLTDTKERLKGEGVRKFVSWNTLLSGPFGETIQQVYNEIYKLY